MKTTLKISVVALSALLLAFTPAHTGSTASKAKSSLNKKTAIKWKSSEIELGEIPQSKPVDINFEFTNTGETPIIINSVQASCGCTSTDYAKTPIAPGETTKITATFNAANKGAFKKTVTVNTTAEEGPRVLTFTGTVI